jgi:hypothetical protein
MLTISVSMCVSCPIVFKPVTRQKYYKGNALQGKEAKRKNRKGSGTRHLLQRHHPPPPVTHFLQLDSIFTVPPTSNSIFKS